MKIKFKISNLALITSLVIGANLFGADKSIKNLTSQKNAKTVPSKVPTKNASTSSNLKLHSLGVGVGQVFLNGDFEDHGNDKIVWDIYYTYSASYSFDFIANFHYSTHKLVDKKSTISGLALGVKAKLYQFDSFSPFVIGGVGFYSPRATREINGALKQSESKVVFGDHIGLGGDLRLNQRVTVAIIGHFHNPFDVEQQDGTADIEGSYFKLLIAALYTF